MATSTPRAPTLTAGPVVPLVRLFLLDRRCRLSTNLQGRPTLSGTVLAPAAEDRAFQKRPLATACNGSTSDLQSDGQLVGDAGQVDHQDWSTSWQSALVFWQCLAGSLRNFSLLPARQAWLNAEGDRNGSHRSWNRHPPEVRAPSQVPMKISTAP